MSQLVVSFEPGEAGRAAIKRALAASERVAYLGDVAPSERAQVLTQAKVLLARNTDKELEDAQSASLEHLSLIQFMSAGVDFIQIDRLPKAVPIASNGGAYAEPMAEHALAMILAATKRLFEEHRQLELGNFNQFSANRMLRDMTVGIVGFGGIGIATARILRALGVRVHAMNRRGASDESVDWIGGVGDLDALLAASDVVVLSLPLTDRSARMIGANELARMKPDAILVNLARGEIVDEAALYDHLKATPAFTACLDAWWVEPIRHGAFRMDRPFLDLRNVIASPHNSASVVGWGAVALERAVANCSRALRGELPHHLIGSDERAFRSS